MNKENQLSQDLHSYSNYHQIRVKHLILDIDLDFNNNIIKGYATLNLEHLSKADSLILDTRDLKIKSVQNNFGENLNFNLGIAHPIFGSPLSIPINNNTSWVKIEYETSPKAAALQWLNPEQTLGKTKPFLFTQSQAILARTWIPLQDAPANRFTYSAKVHTDPGLMVLMSASNPQSKSPQGNYEFEMPQAIPSYLMALCAGDLDFISLGKDCGVYAEPAMVKKAAWEFEDLEKMIKAAEELYGPYAWGRYDVVVLPPSFPFGGMENPRITFATPTIISGDRSLVSLIAHELAHSWSGNLVTNATWNDFWLNEGFTVYFEQRIMEKLYGENYAEMLTALGLGELKNTINSMGEKDPDTHLYLNLENRDPDDGVSDIAYEKGRFFLRTIEAAVGREEFDKWVNSYFKHFKFKSVTTSEFISYLNDHLIKGNVELEQKIRMNDWIFGPGLPDNCPQIISKEFEKTDSQSQAFINGKSASELNTKDWTTHHWLRFLRAMPENLKITQLDDLNNVFKFNETGNSEIACDWFLICIRNNYNAANPYLKKYLLSVGRRKFLKPLYSALSASPQGKKFALEIYKEARPGYHSVSYKTIDEILNDQTK